MRDSHWFKRLEIALEFDAGLEIFLLLGPAELAVPALRQIAIALQRFGAPRWHRLHVEGFDGLIGQPDPGKIHLVHGFERMPRDQAADMAARLNLNRDRLQALDAPILFWIPEDFYEELLAQAPDFVAWRSQATVIPADDIEAGDG